MFPPGNLQPLRHLTLPEKPERSSPSPLKTPSQQQPTLVEPTTPPKPPAVRVPGAPQPILGLVHLEYIGVLEQRDKRERDVGSK